MSYSTKRKGEWKWQSTHRILLPGSNALLHILTLLGPDQHVDQLHFGCAQKLLDDDCAKRRREESKLEINSSSASNCFPLFNNCICHAKCQIDQRHVLNLTRNMFVTQNNPRHEVGSATL